jgi:hypothetical protein
VRIRTFDGREASELFTAAPGDLEFPLTAAQLRSKWLETMSLAMSAEVAGPVLDGLGDPERELAEVLAPAWKAVAAPATG